MSLSSSRSFSELNNVYKTSVNSLLSEDIQRRYQQLTSAEQSFSKALESNWSVEMQQKFAELLRDHTIAKMRTSLLHYQKSLELTLNQVKIAKELPDDQCKKELNNICQYLELLKSMV